MFPITLSSHWANISKAVAISALIVPGQQYDVQWLVSEFFIFFFS